MPLYDVYGLRLLSEREILGLKVAEGAGAEPDVSVKFVPPPLVSDRRSATPWHERGELDDEGEPLLRIHSLDSGSLWFRYSDGVEFLVSEDGDVVTGAWPEDLTYEDAIVYLLGPILGLVLRRYRRTSLHASVVSLGHTALGFLGPAGAGKSTTAAAFSREGFSVLSDDLLVLSEREDEYWAEPGYSTLRLWPAAAEGLYGSPEAIPLIVEGWEKRYLDLSDTKTFCPEQRKLGAIYVLGKQRDPGENTSVEAVPPAEALTILLANSYTGHLPDPEGRRREFGLLSRMVRQVPVRLLARRPGWDELSSLPSQVIDDYQQIAGVSA